MFSITLMLRSKRYDIPGTWTIVQVWPYDFLETGSMLYPLCNVQAIPNLSHRYLKRSAIWRQHPERTSPIGMIFVSNDVFRLGMCVLHGMSIEWVDFITVLRIMLATARCCRQEIFRGRRILRLSSSTRFLKSGSILVSTVIISRIAGLPGRPPSLKPFVIRRWGGNTPYWW